MPICLDNNNGNHHSLNVSPPISNQQLLYPPTVHTPPSHTPNPNQVSPVSIHYGNNGQQQQQPPYPRFPPYDRLTEQQLSKHPDTPTGSVSNNNNTNSLTHSSNSQPNDSTSPFYPNNTSTPNANNSNNNSATAPTSCSNSQQQTQIPSLAATAPPYDCSGRGSITPPSLDGSNGGFGSCKILSDGSITPL
ncbi:hypothetical protein BLA29_011211, partial [Euroglyphus maynei]